MSQVSRWTTTANAHVCAECQTIPPALFEPGSNVTHRIHQGRNGDENLEKSAQDGCRLCISVLDAIRADQSLDGTGLDDGGVLLATTWSGESLFHTTNPSRYDPTPALINLRNAELQALSRDLGVVTGPLLVISWATSKHRTLRFNVQKTKPDGSATSPQMYKTTWDDYRLDFSLPDHAGFGWVRGSRSLPSQPVSTLPNSQETFTLLNKWLDECQERHGSICRFVGERVVSANFASPARLIYCGNQGPLCLVQAADLPLDGEGMGPSYTALSYRWGNPASLCTTTKANLQANLYALNFDGLPLTFQHAIQITRAIKVSYIWIDALCIIQDDEADKAKEIFRMDLIYSTAICMISASSSKDPHAGIFSPRPSTVDAHLRSFTLSSNGAKKGSLSVTIQPFLADWGNAITSGSVYPRGWCFQERLLSKRIIYFTDMRVMWECRWAAASEEYAQMVDVHSAAKIFSPNLPPRVSKDRVQDITILPGDLRRTRPWIEDWCRVIRAYSGRSLTYPSDRLPALAGLAATFGRKLRNPQDPNMSTYLAGMWKDSLAMQICWFPDYTSRPSPKPGDTWPSPLRTAFTFQNIGSADYLDDWLPSWSWISLSGPVHYPYPSGAIDSPSINGRILGVSDKPGNVLMSDHPMEVTALTIIFPHPQVNDKYGPVKGGYINLTSFLGVVTISEDYLLKEEDLLIRPTTTGTRPKLYSMYPSPPPTSLSLLARLRREDRRRPASAEGIIYFDTDPPTLPDKTTIHCLRLGTGPSAFSSTYGAVDYGLALMEVDNSFQLDRRGGVRRVDGSSRSERFPRMRRVGLFEVDIWNKKWRAEATVTSVVIV
ncbi:heterokaryon incompatibility protein-domain-containing protein [Echria macrotheca]|uniref:Heterokaryon incompatibility protein-domain-containing protein n=1 Tax=Echria macrotheca TaxID=438768 RepID=A0AAJ0BG14_9PEZI|nr:heterokaryon incompatibility protein-domain-containing protein [Echria macrotheca]